MKTKNFLVCGCEQETFPVIISSALRLPDVLIGQFTSKRKCISDNVNKHTTVATTLIVTAATKVD